MKNTSKRFMLLAGVFSAFMAVGTVSKVQAQTNAASTMTQGSQTPHMSVEQQKAFATAQQKAKAEMERFNKMTPEEQKAYMEKAQKQADEQFDRISKNLNPEQKKALEAARVKAKAEMERFNKMSPEQKKAYMEKAQEKLGNQMKNMTPEQQQKIEQFQKNMNK